MTRDRFDQILSALKGRAAWETKQLNWYNVRHSGLDRGARPYPGAPNVHFKLPDALIERLKPFFIQLIYGMEVLASFISRRVGQDAGMTSAVASWFDYQLKQRSNFDREIMIAIDQMLQGAMQVVKVRWDVDAKQLAFDARDPLYIIVPRGTQEIKDADWLIDVIPMSVDQYKANPAFNQDEEFVKSIRGKGNTTGDQSGIAGKQQHQEMREGITHSDDEHTIVVWECYLRDRVNKCITVETIAPVLGADGAAIRQPFQLPYNKHLFKTGERFPFMKFRTEVKEKSYYSERGIPEITFQNEQILNKVWNTQLTWMDFFAQPMFRQAQSGGMPNLNNFRTVPGGVAPFGLEPLESMSAPMDLDKQMQFARALAEYRVSVPDLGNSQHLTPYGGSGGDKTAREVSAIVDLSGMSNDVRSRVFRLDLNELLNLSWSLLLQYATEELNYVLQDSVEALDASALHEDYEIQPNGSPDSWNRQGQLAKAVNRFRMFRDDPFINQGELRKSVLELDDPRLIKRLFVEPQEAQQGETENQHVELLLMENRFAAKVDQRDDDKTHLKVIEQWFPVRMQEEQTGEKPPLNAISAGLVFQHIQEHGEALRRKKDPMLRQIDQAMKPISGALLQMSQAQANVIPISQAQGAQQPQPPTMSAPPVEPATLHQQPL